MFLTSLFFGCFEKFLADILFLPSFIVVRHQMGELKGGSAFCPSLSIIGVSRILFKIGLIYASIEFVKDDLFESFSSSNLQLWMLPSIFLYRQASSLELSIFIKHRRYGQTSDDHSDIVLDLFTKNTSLGAPFTTCRFCFSLFLGF